MNIFQYFEASGKAYWIDEQRQSVWFDRGDHVIEKPWDGSYTRTLMKTWYWPVVRPELVGAVVGLGVINGLFGKT